MADVLLGQSYFLRFDPKLWAAMEPYPPLGTLYAASSLRSRGHDVAVFDSMLADGEDEWAAAVARHRPRFAVLYEDGFNYLSKMCLLRMREAAFTMAAAARRAGSTVVAAGPDATDHAAEFLAHGASYVLIGEGEATLAELLDSSGRLAAPPEAVPGLAFPGPSGEIVRTPPREPVRRLDLLPFPAWDLIDVPRYRAIWRRRHGRFSMNLVASRGCPYGCTWCAKPIYGRRYNTRSPENVVAELALLKASYGPDHLWFADDVFGLKPGWIARFADLVVRENLVTPFKCLLRADLVDPAVVAALRRAGCETVWLGAESGSQKILDAMEKGIRLEQIATAARLLRQAGIRVGFFLQFGYPGEGWQEIQETLAMVSRCRPDDIGVSVSYPLPGTTFYEDVKAQLGPRQNWIDSDDLAMLYQGPYPPDFYRALHRLVHQEFRLRRIVDDLSGAIRHPLRVRPRHVRLAAAGLYHALALPLQRRRVAHAAGIGDRGLEVSGRGLG
ncbi:MAG: B12-binding domain-containing radical SAM protein [Chloroflexi bacterium]|nr:B12-binding domain-containing radical SAM protein [Chloroflexota bacterium]